MGEPVCGASPRHFSIAVLSVIMVITFAARYRGGDVAPFPILGGGTALVLTYTFP